MNDLFKTLGDLNFSSRRSPVFSRNGMVCSSQPLASEIGIKILRDGGNAVDAAIAVAAALSVVEPGSTGLGGDCFLLYYDSKTKQATALNGSGRCPSSLSLEIAREDAAATHNCDLKSLPNDHVHCVTVPGTAAGWADAIEKWGKMSLAQVLEPAAQLAEDGFPVAPVASLSWQMSEEKLKRSANFSELLIKSSGGEYRAPKIGEIFRNTCMAETLRELGKGGKKAFYEGRVAEAIVEILSNLGGKLSLQDMMDHESTFHEPIRVRYRGFDVLQAPPNGQGLAALLALNILKCEESKGTDFSFKKNKIKYGSALHLHTMVEAMRLAFADARKYVADPEFVEVPSKQILCERYASMRRNQINPEKATVDVHSGCPDTSSDTVSFQVVDTFGNAVSMVNSTYMSFGSGIIPKGCGFTLQNRGANFSLVSGHRNCLAPNKRPYHTIIPGMVLHSDSRDLFASFTNMGGFMQPQGHLQLLVNMLDFGMDPQTAIDAPRFCIMDGEENGVVAFEEGVEESVVNDLAVMGHRIFQGRRQGKLLRGLERFTFGRAQIIVRDRHEGILCGGSDGRADGCALGY